MALLEAQDISHTFVKADGTKVDAVRDVSFSVQRGQTLGIVGESGSGKSTIGRLVLGLLTAASGEIRFSGVNLGQLTASELRRTRGQMGAVFQEPFESLNPRLKINSIIEEPLIIHRRDLSPRDRRDRVLSVLNEVNLAAEIADRYPRSLSGGQQQRVGLARALIGEPLLLVLDEPTSSLDFSIRSQMLRLLAKLQAAHNLTMLMITHDIGSISHLATEVLVLHQGKVVEHGPTKEVLDHPSDPYTRQLLAARLAVRV